MTDDELKAQIETQLALAADHRARLVAGQPVRTILRSVMRHIEWLRAELARREQVDRERAG
jgi:hypothetical protein